MGCFLGCFGGRRKNRRCQRRRESFQPPRLNRISEVSTKDNHLKLRVPIVKEVTKDDHLILKVPSVEEVPKINDICDKVEEKHSPSPTRKRVTFDSNVKTYEHIEVDESVEIFEEKKEEVKPLDSTLARSSSDGSNVTSISSGSSYPANHRYQNCRESDDDEEEDDVIDCGESDIENIDDEGLLQDDYYDDNYDSDKEVYTEEIADNVLDIESIEKRTRESNASARDRSGYVNAVLNPIENLTQWKALKSKGRTTQTPNHKENANLISDQEHKRNASFSLEPPPRVDELPSFSLKPKPRDETKKQRTQEIAVDASLSTWLSTTTSGCSSSDTSVKNKTISSYSKPVQSHDERPVFYALTAEEIKQFSATNSPRKSPSRSPESPIIGTVGGYWNNRSMANTKYSS